MLVVYSQQRVTGYLNPQICGRQGIMENGTVNITRAGFYLSNGVYQGKITFWGKSSCARMPI
jgi:hypothetical protein